MKSLETFLPTELLKDLEALAVEEGRDVEAVVAAAVRRYLWDSTFRTLRRHAQARSRVQGWVSDQSILTTVLAMRRPDEFTLTKPELNPEAVAGEGVEAGDVVATGTSSRTREPRDSRERPMRRDRREPREPRESPRALREPREVREPRERMPEMETRSFERSLPSPEADVDVVREDREERGGRMPRRRTRGGRREESAGAKASSSPDALEPEMTPEPRMPAPSYAVNTPNVDLAAIRRRAESVHRFLPPDPSERESHEETRANRESRVNHESEAAEEAPRAARASVAAATASAEPNVHSRGAANEEAGSPSPSSRPWNQPSPSSSVSASASPASLPVSPVASPPAETTQNPAPASFGRKPKRSSGRR